MLSVIQLRDVLDVRSGKTTSVFKQKSTNALSPPEHCFSLVFTGWSLDLQTETNEMRNNWVEALTTVVENARREAGLPPMTAAVSTGPRMARFGESMRSLLVVCAAFECVPLPSFTGRCVVYYYMKLNHPLVVCVLCRPRAATLNSKPATLGRSQSMLIGSSNKPLSPMAGTVGHKTGTVHLLLAFTPSRADVPIASFVYLFIIVPHCSSTRVFFPPSGSLTCVTCVVYRVGNESLQ